MTERATRITVVVATVAVLGFTVACGGEESSAPTGGAPAATAEDSDGGVRLPEGEIPGEITGPELGTSPATFRQEGDELVIELDEGALVYRGPIDAGGMFRCTIVEPVSEGTIEVIEGTITGDTIEGSITRKGAQPEQITGKLEQAASG